ncbi:MAG: serine/threonine-protein kinase [Acidobacteria bacterium]|nr:MAG: serine/threonine-protein kinase [Acidobacteriota bacterium]
MPQRIHCVNNTETPYTRPTERLTKPSHHPSAFEKVHYLVLELVEGETLADKLRGGPLSVEEALRIALQIAEALDAAHEKAIIHRDLKPANTMVTPDGDVIVLDFGLAKAFIDDASGDELAESPTLSAAATREGVILGTAAYMSPEQARGKEVDKRTDIFSFGAVLYEMLTGRRAFPGEDVSETLAAVIKTEPDWSYLPASTDPRIRALLQGCLQKNRRKRRRNMGDVLAEIREVLTSDSIRLSPRTEPTTTSRTILVAALFSVVAGVIGWSLRAPAQKPVTRLEMLLPLRVGLARQPGVAISPDGTNLVFVSGMAGPLYLRVMDEKEAKLISGTEGARAPFFSPDGQWIGFWNRAEHTLNKVSIRGGSPVPLCPVEDFTGASWGSTDSIVFGQGVRGIWQVSADGGTPEVLIDFDEAEGLSAHRPQMLPGRDAVLFALASGVDWNNASIVVKSLDTGQKTC